MRKSSDFQGDRPRLLLTALVCVGCLFAKAAADSADVVMRPGGDVATISAALEKVRALRESGAIPPDRPAVVRVEAGRYAVKEAATFGPADSNIRFVAANKGRAVFDGGVALPPFKAGDLVRVTQGPFYGVEGYIRRDEGGTAIVLNVEILGQAVAVTISPSDCEKLP